MTVLLNPYMFSSFSPSDIAGLNIWYDASDTGTITDSSGDVSQWDDKSGNGVDLVQGTAGIRPRTGDATQNGLNVLSFASGDRLAIANSSLLLDSQTIFVVWRKTGTANTFESFPLTITNASGLGRPFDRWSDSSSNTWVINNTGTASGSLVNLRTQTSWCIMSALIEQDGGGVGTHTIDEYKDGVLQASVSVGVSWDAGATGRTITVGARTGGTTALTGDVAEVIAYDALLGTTDREAVEAYLSGKWGI